MFNKSYLKTIGNSFILKMAPRAGLEPATVRLTAGCSTTELPRNTKLLLIKNI